MPHVLKSSTVVKSYYYYDNTLPYTSSHLNFNNRREINGGVDLMLFCSRLLAFLSQLLSKQMAAKELYMR